jgi:hypothetical protein
MGSPLRFWWLGFAFIIVYWVLLFFDQYPAPYLDDGFFIGAALNLAQHGVFSNPLCDCFATIGCSDHFFAYMPFHSYVLAAWIKLAGISTLSFCAFYAGLSLAVSLLIFRFIPAGKYAPLHAVLICFTVYEFLGGVGFRPDSLGLCLFLIGINVCQSKSLGIFFLKNLSLAAVVITYPNLGICAVLVSISSLVYPVAGPQRPVAQLIPKFLALLAAYLLSFLVFLYCIDGRFFEFLNGLHGNQQLAATGVRDRFFFFTPLGIAKWLVVQCSFLIFILTLIFLWRKDTTRRGHFFYLILVLLGFSILGISSYSSATAQHLWAFYCLTLSLVLIATFRWEKQLMGAWVIVFVITSFGHGHVAIQDCLADRRPTREEVDLLRYQVEQLHPRRLYLDPYAMRALYDYRLPPNAHSYEESDTFGWGPPSNLLNLPRDAVFVVSVMRAIPTPKSPHAGEQAQLQQILGHPIPKIFKNPYTLVIMEN